MKILLPFKIALVSLKNNMGRTMLTILGIAIGIAAVIIVLSAGESLKGLVMDQIDAFGSDIIQVETRVPQKGTTGSASSMAQGVVITTFKNSEMEDLAKLGNIKNYYGATIGQSVVSYLDQNKVINYFAVSSGFIDIDKSEIAYGRFFSDDEDRELARVAVIGSKVKEKLFGDQDPIGIGIKVGRQKFTVIGVLEERGSSFGFDFDNIIYLPLNTVQKTIMGVDYIQMAVYQMRDTSKQEITADDIRLSMRQWHEIDDPKDDDFAVTTMDEMREIIDTVFGGITLLLIAVAGISLLVGGVGIMNIMYVSVTERTFEIGLRKAVGAKRNQILWQFLWEAIVVTIFGGVIGIIAGILLSILISYASSLLGFSWQFLLPPSSILISFGFCALVGLVFGYYPARAAASLNPINALGRE